jgi:peptidoglycan/LPS O-acetylase OafA/YrhL
VILTFLMLFAGGMLVGGAYSFHKGGKPVWARIALLVIGLACIGVSIWSIQNR